MGATVQLPDVLADQLEMLAREEGTSVGGLLSRLVSEHIGRAHAQLSAREEGRRPAAKGLKAVNFLCGVGVFACDFVDETRFRRLPRPAVS